MKRLLLHVVISNVFSVKETIRTLKKMLDNNINFLFVSGDGHQLFSCQLRLFKSWYKSWNDQEKQTFLRTLSTSDAETDKYLRDRQMSHFL